MYVGDVDDVEQKMFCIHSKDLYSDSFFPIFLSSSSPAPMALTSTTSTNAYCPLSEVFFLNVQPDIIMLHSVVVELVVRK